MFMNDLVSESYGSESYGSQQQSCYPKRSSQLKKKKHKVIPLYGMKS